MILCCDVSECCHLEEVEAIEFWIQFAKELQSNGRKPEGFGFFFLTFVYFETQSSYSLNG